MASSVQIWDISMSVVIFIFMTFLIICYVIQRKAFPIAQRYPLVVIFEIASVGISGIITCLTFAFPGSIFSNCQAFLLFVELVNNAANASFVYRIQCLFMKDFSTKLLVQQANADEFSDEISKDLKVSKKDGFLFKAMFTLLSLEMKYFGPWIAALVNTFPILLGAFISCVEIAITLPSVYSADCLVGSSEVTMYVSRAMYIYLLLCAIPVFVLFGKMKDGLSLVLELRLLILFIGFAFAGLFFRDHPEVYKWIDPVETFAVLCITFFPIMISFRHKEVKKELSSIQTSSIGEVIEELRSVIGTAELRQLFLKHLEMEYSVENLSFYEACVSLEIMIQHSRTRNEIVEKIIFIRDNFLLTSAISCVNISHPNRLKALETLGTDQSISSASNEAFLGALKEPKEEILKLMATDSFGRFKRSPAYQDTLNSTLKKSSKSSQLKTSWNSISFAGKVLGNSGKETDLEVLSPLKE
jgi:hypothetical protein